MCLLQEKEPRDLDDGVCDGGRMECPSPRCVFGNKATRNRPYCGTEQWGKRIKTNGFTALFCLPAITQYTTTNLRWSAINIVLGEISRTASGALPPSPDKKRNVNS